MITMTVVTVAVYALLGTFINLIIKGSATLANAIFEGVDDIFTAANPVSKIVGMIPLPYSDDFNFGTVIFALAFAIILVGVSFGILKSIVSGVTGDKAEHPLYCLGRGVMAIFLLFIFFGEGGNGLSLTSGFLGASETTNAANIVTRTYQGMVSGGLVGEIGKAFSWFMNSLYTFMSTSTKAVATEGGSIGAISFNFNPTEYIGTIVIACGIYASILAGALGLLERLISYGIYVLIGPVALSLYSFRDMQSSAKEWIKGLFVQYFVIFLVMLMWTVAMSELDQYLEYLAGDWQGGESAEFSKTISTGALTIVFFSITTNAEELLNVIGIRTMSPMDSARAVGAGVGTALRASNMLGSFADTSVKAGKEIGGELSSRGITPFGGAAGAKAGSSASLKKQGLTATPATRSQDKANAKAISNAMSKGGKDAEAAKYAKNLMDGNGKVPYQFMADGSKQLDASKAIAAYKGEDFGPVDEKGNHAFKGADFGADKCNELAQGYNVKPESAGETGNDDTTPTGAAGGSTNSSSPENFKFLNVDDDGNGGDVEIPSFAQSTNTSSGGGTDFNTDIGTDSDDSWGNTNVMPDATAVRETRNDHIDVVDEVLEPGPRDVIRRKPKKQNVEPKVGDGNDE